MKKTNNPTTYFLVITFSLVIMSNFGCKKYLEEKPDQTLTTIETVEDMQALLDFFNRMNASDAGVANTCSDDYYITDAVFDARNEYDKNLYLWRGENNFTPSSNPWRSTAEMIYIANTVIDAAEKKQGKIADGIGLNHVSAQALFHRSRGFLNLIGAWTKAYDPQTAKTDLGIPLRLNPDFNQPSVRSSLANSYAQVINDLKKALPHLPVKPISAVRPSKGGAYGLLSRAYLQMSDYEMAGLYADSCLQLQSTLLDYNTLMASANFPIAQQNVEVVFDCRAPASGTTSQTRALINPELYGMYQANDLRKTVFFKSSGSAYIFKGYYAGAALTFSGIATDEMLLTRAECAARRNNINVALSDLNLLLVNRFKKGTYIPYQNMSQSSLLNLIKTERRKELLFRNLRWMDLKRWNLEGDNIVLSRTVAGVKTSLLSNSLLYAIAIPEDVITLSGMQQNPR